MTDVFEPRWLAGERVLDVAPRFTPRVGEAVPRRLNHVPGRTLTADALTTEQRQRNRRLQFLARAVEPGILAGLEVQAVAGAGGAPALAVAAGVGLTAAGEEVVLHRPLVAALDDIPPSEPLIEADPEPRGLVVISLRPVRAVSAFAADDEDPCPTDATAYPYADIVTVDAARLVWSRIGEPGAFASLLPPAADAPPGMAEQMVQPPPRALFGDETPPPRPVSVHRNLVARRMLEEEAAAAGRHGPPPWARHGVPLALAEITAEGELVFLDRFAVARAGGAVKAPRPVATALPRPLARARFEQFVDHLQALRSEGAELAHATRHFRYLPPVGILPATLVDFAPLAGNLPIRADFFPARFRIEAAPIPLEQLEAALALRAGLAPYDLARPDYVQLIVPVPEHLYEPRLLVMETIDPAFDAAIAAAEAELALREVRLARLNRMEHSVVGLIDRAEIAPVAPGQEGDDWTEPPRFDHRARALVEKLAARIQSLPPLPPEAGSLSLEAFDAMVANPTPPAPGDAAAFRGLKPTVADLAGRLEKADDAVDMSFVRVQTEIYRARRHLIGETDYSRLATSPVLANLAVTTTGVQTSAVLQNLFQTQRAAPEPRTAMPLPGQGTPGPAGAAGGGIAGVGFDSFLADRRSLDLMSGAIGTRAFAASALGADLMTSASPLALSMRDITASSLVGGATIDLRSAQSAAGTLALPQFSAERLDLSQVQVSTASVALQGLLYGKASPIRTVTVAERLRPSPAQESKNGAVASKAETVRMLQALGLDLTGLQLPIGANRIALVAEDDFEDLLRNLEQTEGTGEALRVLRNTSAVRRVQGYAVVSDRHLLASAAIMIPNLPAARERLVAIARQLYDRRVDLATPELPALILGDVFDPDPPDPDEAAFYSAAVDALESTVSILRLVEGRVHGYQGLLEVLRDALAGAYGLAEDWRGAIEAEAAARAEAEHDRAVAQALRAEELARLDAINTRRRDILDKHVDIVAFARPRGIDRFADAPGLDLFGPPVDPIPACLERGHEPPRELEEMLDGLREVPIGWFAALRGEIDRIDQSHRLLDAFSRARLRATEWLVRHEARSVERAQAVAQTRLAGRAAVGVQIAIQAFDVRLARTLDLRARLPLDTLAPLGWKALRDRALAELSIEDLAVGGRDGAALAQAGLVELGHIGSVAACLLEVLRQVPAGIRLAWAEALSAHDEAPDLSRISVAPRWSEIALPERRELEHLHRWLFGRVDTAIADARAAMSEIVRVCLLLASHAPVSGIVVGRPERNDTVATGQTFQVAVAQGRPAIGMAVAFGAAATPARGVIEDIVGERVLVRVTAAPAGPVALTPATELRFARQVEGQLLGALR